MRERRQRREVHHAAPERATSTCAARAWLIAILESGSGHSLRRFRAVVTFCIVKPPVLDEFVFIEANERPGLANHEPQPVVERFLDLLFPQTIRIEPQRPGVDHANH